jgi:hypothetical protein
MPPILCAFAHLDSEIYRVPQGEDERNRQKFLRDGKFEILTKSDLMDTVAVLMEQKR